MKKEWCIDIVENRISAKVKGDDRVRFGGRVSELENKVVRVVILAHRQMIHNAFPDRGFKE